MSGQGARKIWLLGSAAVVVVGGLLTSAALAQSTQDNAQTDELGEVIVTAQKREQRLQDVPIAVTAVTGQQLQEMQVLNFQETDIPSVKVTQQGMSDSLNIRGIGSGTNLGFEQSVPIYIDGIYFGRARVQRLAFLDLQQLEVLKGPQPTYLGRNAIGGALSITSQDPTSDLSGSLNATSQVDGYDGFVVSGAVSGPLAEGLGARFAFERRDTDGYLRNIATQQNEPRMEDTLGRLVFDWRPSDRLSFRASAWAAVGEQFGRANQPIFCPAQYRTNFQPLALSGDTCELDDTKASLAFYPVGTPEDRLFFDADGESFYNELQMVGASLRADYDLGGGYSLTSVTGAYQFTNRQFADNDLSIANIALGNFIEDFSQFSQEVRIASPIGERFDWLVGAYFDSNSNDLDQVSIGNRRGGAIPGSPFANGVLSPTFNFTAFNHARESAESWAIFGDLGIRLAEPLTLRFGARYEETDKSATNTACSGPVFQRETACDAAIYGAFTDLSGSRTDTRFQPTVTLEYRPIEDVLLYASAKEGFKAGGFDFTGNPAFTYDPETVEAFEAGTKTRFWDRRVLLNLAAFRSDYSDLQLSSFNADTGLTSVRNAGTVRSQGVELETQFAPIDGLTFGINATWLDSEYTDYSNAPCYTGQSAAQGCVTAVGGTFQDLTGQRTNYAPTFSATYSVNYRRPVFNDMTLGIYADAFQTEEFVTLTDNNPISIQPGYTKYNARLSIGAEDRGWALALVGKNITDERTSSFRNVIPGGTGTAATGFAVAAFTDPPQTWVLQLDLRY